VLPLFTAVSILGTVVGQLVVLGLLESRVLRTASRVLGLVLLLVLMALSYAAMAPVMGVSEPLAPWLSWHYPLSSTSRSCSSERHSVRHSTRARSSLEGRRRECPSSIRSGDSVGPRLWFADATPAGLMQRDTASVTGTTLAAEGATGRSVQAFPPRLGPRPLAVALGLWIRWLRIPVRFSALFPLVIVLVAALFTAVGDPSSLPLVVGGVLIFAGVYVSGAVFGLNPLGEAADMRIVEFLSPTTPRTLVIGHVLAGLLVGSPVGVAGAAILAAAMDLSAPTALAIGILTVVLTIASGGAAVGIGSVLTSTDAQQTYRGYEVATPSQWALVAYMVTAVLLVVVAAMGAVLVLLSSDTGTGSSLFVAASGLAAVILLSVGYAGFRVAVGRFGALPYRDADDDGAVSQSPGADGSASTDTLQAPNFTRTQQVRGLVLLGAFVVIRALLARAWDRYFPGGYSTDPLFLAFLGGHFSFSRSAWSASASRAGWVSTSCGGGSTGSNSAATSVGESPVSYARACRHPWRDLFPHRGLPRNCTCGGGRCRSFPDCDGGSSERLRSEPAARVVLRVRDRRLPGGDAVPRIPSGAPPGAIRTNRRDRRTGGYLHPCTPRVLPGLRVAAAPRRVPRRYRHWMAR